jgi:hypothetical protein
MFALSLPAVLGVVGLATDFAMLQGKQAVLQAAADQAALAATKELTLASASKTTIEHVARATALANISDEAGAVEVTAVIDDAADSVKVTITQQWAPFLAHMFEAAVTPVVVDATAALYGESKLCVLALSPTEYGAVALTKAAKMQADGCTVYSNSKHSGSLHLGDTATVEAGLVCTVGGVSNNGGLNADKVVTDCPVLADPLAARAAPKIGTCDQSNVKITTGTVMLQPGVYCGGIRVSGAAVVNFSEGEYIIKDGPLHVTDTAQIHGKNVGFYFKGSMSGFWFLKDATIDLEGREEGTMAGLLFHDDPLNANLLRTHYVSATKAHNLTGTIYLPGATFMIDPAASVAGDSAYTAIVAKRLLVQNGPTLVLNTNYSDTPVPVPNGIKAAADVRLVN